MDKSPKRNPPVKHAGPRSEELADIEAQLEEFHGIV